MPDQSQEEFMGTNGFSSAIHALLPRIRERRAEIEDARRLPRDIVEGLAATGVFRLGVPKSLGGDEADALDLLHVIETLSTADGSTGWCSMLGIGGGIVAGYMREDGAREVFADPCAPTALVAEPAGAAVREGDGVRVNGRWRFASGVTHAGWIVLGCIVMKDGAPNATPHGPEIVHVFVPTKDIQIHDTWHVSGLCGTGSNDVSCQDVFVPDSRVFSLFDSTRFRREPLYQMPVLTQVAPAISIVALGIARAALDEVTEIARTKVPSMSMARLAERPVGQVEIARAEGALGAARSFLYDVTDDIWQTVVAGDVPTMRQRSLCRIASNHASEVAAGVARTASTLAGSNSVYTTSSLQRHSRDAEVITHHFTQSPHVWEDAGRALVGIEPQAPLF
jgi:alkylation response protein AidB-like acyl-CoA dehydrogenase